VAPRKFQVGFSFRPSDKGMCRQGRFGQQGVDSSLTSENCLMVAKVILSVKGVRAAGSQHTEQKSGTVSPHLPLHTPPICPANLCLSQFNRGAHSKSPRIQVQETLNMPEAEPHPARPSSNTMLHLPPISAEPTGGLAETAQGVGPGLKREVQLSFAATRIGQSGKTGRKRRLACEPAPLREDSQGNR
jgi:hypothetical protein